MGCCLSMGLNPVVLRVAWRLEIKLAAKIQADLWIFTSPTPCRARQFCLGMPDKIALKSNF